MLFEKCLGAGVPEADLAPVLVPSMHDPNGYVIFPQELRALTGLARMSGATRVVESGSYSGSSAGAVAMVCDDVWSIDTNDLFFDPGFAAYYGNPRGPGFRLPLETRHRVNFVWGIAKDKLRNLVSSRRPTMFFHDSDHSAANIQAELTAAFESGAVAIAAHDLNVPETRGGWNAWVAAHEINGAEFAATPLGLGLWLRTGSPRRKSSAS